MAINYCICKASYACESYSLLFFSSMQGRQQLSCTVLRPPVSRYLSVYNSVSSLSYLCHSTWLHIHWQLLPFDSVTRFTLPLDFTSENRKHLWRGISQIQKVCKVSSRIVNWTKQSKAHALFIRIGLIMKGTLKCSNNLSCFVLTNTWQTSSWSITPMGGGGALRLATCDRR